MDVLTYIQEPQGDRNSISSPPYHHHLLFCHNSSVKQAKEKKAGHHHLWPSQTMWTMWTICTIWICTLHLFMTQGIPAVLGPVTTSILGGNQIGKYGFKSTTVSMSFSPSIFKKYSDRTLQSIALEHNMSTYVHNCFSSKLATWKLQVHGLFMVYHIIRRPCPK